MERRRPGTIRCRSTGDTGVARRRDGRLLLGVAGAASGLSLDAATGVITGTPVAAAAGADCTTTFAFDNRVESGTAYGVTIVQQPSQPSWACVLASGTGTVGATDVTGVEVSCRSVWRQVAGGSEHSAGLRPDGTLWAWGHNGHDNPRADRTRRSRAGRFIARRKAR